MEEINNMVPSHYQNNLQLILTLDLTEMPVEVRVEPYNESLPAESTWQEHVVEEWKKITGMAMENPGEVLIVESLFLNGSFKLTHVSSLFMSVEHQSRQRLQARDNAGLAEVKSDDEGDVEEEDGEQHAYW
jgi:hypothetical protein